MFNKRQETEMRPGLVHVLGDFKVCRVAGCAGGRRGERLRKLRWSVGIVGAESCR